MVGAHLGPIWGPILFGTHLGLFGVSFYLFGAHLGPIWGPIFVRAIWPILALAAIPYWGAIGISCYSHYW